MAKSAGLNTEQSPSPTVGLTPLVATVAEREAAAAVDARDIADAIASITPAERILFHRRVADRRVAGEGEPGIEWRALVDVRIECGHWRTIDNTSQPVAVAAVGEER